MQSLGRIFISAKSAILGQSYTGGCLLGLISSQALNHHPDLATKAQLPSDKSLSLSKVENDLLFAGWSPPLNYSPFFSSIPSDC